jgi:SAM-dependent methyltransferase
VATLPCDRKRARSNPAIAPAATDALLQRFRDLALRAGYDRPVVEEARRLRGFVAAAEAMPSLLSDGDEFEPLRALVALMTLGAGISRAEAARALHPLTADELVRAGLLERDGQQLRCPFHAVAHDGLMLIGDGRSASHRDFVSALFGPSVLAANLTPRGPRRAMLDLGTGSGVQALLAARHCERVVGVDINPRALAFADLNARMNGVRHAQWRDGSWLEPVSQERFDLIVCNPPYVVSPDHEFTYRDSALPASVQIAELCGDIPEYLDDGGVAIILAMWPHAGRDDWDAVPRGWAQISGCDAIVTCFGTVDALDDAVRWNSPPSRRLEPAEFEQTIARWHGYHRELETGMVSFGAIVLRRREGRAPWALVARVSGEPGEHAARQIDRAIAGNDLLRCGKDLLARSYAIPEGLSVSQRFVLREGGWAGKAAVVGVPGELGVGAEIDPDALDVLFRCDGRASLSDLARGHVDETLVASAASELLSAGLLEIT